jgi:uncharacterized protein (TIGR03067 family)
MQRFIVAPVALLAVMLTGNIPAEDIGSKDYDPALAGGWRYEVSYFVDSKGEAFFSKIGSSADGSPAGISIDARGVRGIWSGKLWMNPDTKPAHIHIYNHDARGLPFRLTGVYKVEADTLTICAVEAGKARPRDFEWRDKPGRTLYIFKRAKPEKAK